MATALAHPVPLSPYDLDAYDYELPPGAIAQEPAPRRDEARLLVLERASGARRHLRVSDLPEVLRAGDLLVMNDTRVIPARLRGTTETGGHAEVLLIRPTGKGTWLALGKPSKRLKLGRTITFSERGVGRAVPGPPGLDDVGTRRAEDGPPYTGLIVGNEDGHVELRFERAPIEQILARCGELPLPPYIERHPGPSPADAERYQTVYARVPGAIAAPTAGLHFTPELLERLRAGGVETAMVTLHVGPGTFQPVRSGDVRQHRMEAEWAEIPEATADAIERAKREGRRVIAIGTTTARALESRAAGDGGLAGAGWAAGFIFPGYRFRVLDGLLTNFHLPRSTLLMLVAALAGREVILDAYREAVQLGYRFYSYGDASLIL